MKNPVKKGMDRTHKPVTHPDKKRESKKNPERNKNEEET